MIKADHLTKEETAGRWHAVEWFATNVRTMREQEFPPRVLATEVRRLAQARKALRKVNELRKQGL